MIELKLITTDKLGDDKLSEMKITELEAACLNYFQVAKMKNPIFKYYDLENNNLQVIWEKYKEYHKNSIQENEKQAYDLVIKILLDESLKKISK